MRKRFEGTRNRRKEPGSGGGLPGEAKGRAENDGIEEDIKFCDLVAGSLSRMCYLLL
jgi:hypothetical protein